MQLILSGCLGHYEHIKKSVSAICDIIQDFPKNMHKLPETNNNFRRFEEYFTTLPKRNKIEGSPKTH